MSSQGSATVTNTQFVYTDRLRTQSQGAVTWFGSFQGNGASAPLVAQQRGSHYTVSRVSAGRYRVQLLTNPNTSYLVQTPVQGVGPGYPKGLMQEPDCWITNETAGRLPAVADPGNTGAPTVAYSLFASRLDQTTPGSATYNTFDVWVFTGGAGAIPATPADLTTADRVTFALTYKQTAFEP